MSEKCEVCGKRMGYQQLTHCSNDCLFSNIDDTRSVSKTPFEKWDKKNYWL